MNEDILEVPGINNVVKMMRHDLSLEENMTCT